MTEYIVDVPDEEVELFIARFGIEGTTMFGYRLADEVVRCRDFRYTATTPIGELVCAAHDKALFLVEPDWFCALGSKRGFYLKG